METERELIRFGLSAREAAERWSDSAGRILSPSGQDGLRIEEADELTWNWQMGQVEVGRLRFRDAGARRGEADIEISRSDTSATHRLRDVVDGLSDILQEAGLDPPVVARDPHAGEPPEAATDREQPL